MNETWSLKLEDGGELNNQNKDYDDLNISISGHLTPDNLENCLMARTQTHQYAGVLDLQALHQETVTLRIEANSHCADQNRLAFVRFDDNSDVLSVNGIQADGSEAFKPQCQSSSTPISNRLNSGTSQGQRNGLWNPQLRPLCQC